MTERVLFERKGAHVALVTINRPLAMNALSADIRAGLCAAFAQVRDDPSIRAAVLTGSGTRAFTAGLDLKELGQDTGNLGAANDRDAATNPVAAVAECGKPVIGAINGVAITGGFELALACSFRIGSPNARFADTHALVGIMPGWGLSQRLQRTIGLGRAREMSFTGRLVDAETACQWGLINRIVPSDRLVEEALKLADDIAFVDPDFIRAYSDLIDDGADGSFSQGMALENERSLAHNATVTAASVEERRLAVVERGRKQM